MRAGRVPQKIDAKDAATLLTGVVGVLALSLAGCNTVTVVASSTPGGVAADLVDWDGFERDRLLQQGLIDTNRRLDNLLTPSRRSPLVLVPRR